MPDHPYARALYSRIFNMFPDILAKHEALIEGINACLTGYVLFKRHPECYTGWRSNQLSRCSISYRERVRLFSTLCQVIGISPVIDFHLSQDTNFDRPWRRMIDGIHSAGFRQFRYELDGQTAFRESDFREICAKRLPEFKKIYESKDQCLDFSRLH